VVRARSGFVDSQTPKVNYNKFLCFFVVLDLFFLSDRSFLRSPCSSSAENEADSTESRQTRYDECSINARKALGLPYRAVVESLYCMLIVSSRIN